MSIKFINNQTGNHTSEIIQLFSNADEIWMATAFLKESGLNKLINSIQKHINAKKPISIIAGGNFALTEPTSLLRLHDIINKTSNSILHLASLNNAKPIFHPKLFIFKSGNKYTIISGSANITQGGLENNVECSIVVTGYQNDKCIQDALSYYKLLLTQKYSIVADLVVIKNYETFFIEQKKHNKSSKAVPNVKLKQKDIHYFGFLDYFNEFNKNVRAKENLIKSNNYAEAIVVLNEIADMKNLTEASFKNKLDSLVGSAEKENLWHSGSLFRLRRKVYPYYKEFQELIKYIRDNKNKSAEIVFENAKEKVSHIEGAGINYVTEIMMTYNPKSFANMNQNPIRCLREVGRVNVKRTVTSYTGKQYIEYCAIIKDIIEHFALRDFLEADTYFNYIFWKLKEKK